MKDQGQLSEPDDSDKALCLAGKKLYGDDFTPEQIQQWYEDERRAYTELKEASNPSGPYPYHALNWYYGFRHLGDRRNLRVLGFGSFTGEELRPILNKTGRLVIVDPSDAAVGAEIDGVPATYVKPRPDGVLPFEDGGFDLVTCFGVLHHIPNVSAVVRELSRCTSVGGRMLLREPITSMGDWRSPRKGLTKRERGIPRAILRRIALEAGFAIRRERTCMFSVVGLLLPRIGVMPYSSRALVRLDRLCCAMFGWNEKYHRDKLWRKIAPWCVFLDLEKSPSR